MIEQAITKIQQLAASAIDTKFIKAPGDPAHVLYRVTPGTEPIRVEVTPGNRNVKLFSIADLIAMGQTHFDATMDETDRMLCFYNDDNVQLVFDYRTGRERATIELEPTDEFAFFDARLASPTLAVKDLRHALRVLLRKTYADAAIVEQVSALAFVNTDRGSAASGRGKESIRSDILEQVEEPAKLPDPFQTFNVRACSNPDLDVRFPIQCVLDPDTSTRQWYLRPLEDSWLDYLAMNTKLVGDRLRTAFAKTNVRVFEGHFNQDQPK